MNNKTILPFILILFFSNIIVYGQNKKDTSKFAGVFLTVDDYKNNRLSYIVNKDSLNQKFKYINAYTKIKIINADTTVKIKLGEIYGFNKYGKKYRYFEGNRNWKRPDESYYRIFYEDDLIHIYVEYYSDGTFVMPGPGLIPIIAVGGTTKKTTFYYSKTFTSSFKRLSKKNISLDYPNNQEILKLLNDYLQ